MQVYVMSLKVMETTLLFPPLYQIASYFPHSLVALANKHLSILREVCVINDSITHHPVRSHSTHPCARSI